MRKCIILFMKIRPFIARIMIALVTFFNLQCAILFLFFPSVYASGFELAGISGENLVRGLGILFIMWNVPYLVALVDPIRYRISLYEAIAMQAIGLAGESFLLMVLPTGHTALRLTAIRFIAFDGSGLLLLILALILTIRIKPAAKPAENYS